MILNGLSELTSFLAGHASSKKPLESWKTLIEKNSFEHHVALKKTFGAVDYVAPDTIFDIGGNKFRLVAIVSYEAQIVFIKHVFTHGGYEAWSKTRKKGKGKRK